MSTTRPGRCNTCGWTLRPPRTTLDAFPETRLMVSPGICTRCHYELNEGPAPEPVFDLNHAASALGYWIQNRRNRGVPADGYPV